VSEFVEVCRPSEGTIADVSIAASVYLASAGRGGVSLACRANGGNLQYRATLFSSGPARISVWNGTSTELTSGPVGTTFVKDGFNRVRFDCIGSTFTLWVDEVKVLEVVDSTFATGTTWFGLDGHVSSIGGESIVVDDVVIYRR